MIASLPGHDGQLKDPGSKASEQPAYATNANRALRDQFLVVIGNCTHLGCLPKPRFEKAQPELRCRLAGRLLLPLPRFAFRSGRSRVRGLACLGQPAHPAVFLQQRQHAGHR
jgi:hypothetical protein